MTFHTLHFCLDMSRAYTHTVPFLNLCGDWMDFLWVWHLHPSFVYSTAPYLSKAKGLYIPDFLIRELKVPGDKALNNSLMSLRIIPHEPYQSMNQSRRVERARKSGTLERKASLNQTLRSK